MERQRTQRSLDAAQDLARAALVAKAASAASLAHQGDTEEDGGAYENHLCRVADRLADAGFGVEDQAAAWLHDAVEDTDMTLGQVRHQFGKAVADRVDGATRRSGNGHKETYVTEFVVRAARSPGLSVKMSDVLDHLRPGQEAWLAEHPGMDRRYCRALVILRDEMVKAAHRGEVRLEPARLFILQAEETLGRFPDLGLI